MVLITTTVHWQKFTCQHSVTMIMHHHQLHHWHHQHQHYQYCTYMAMQLHTEIEKHKLSNNNYSKLLSMFAVWMQTAALPWQLLCLHAATVMMMTIMMMLLLFLLNMFVLVVVITHYFLDFVFRLKEAFYFICLFEQQKSSGMQWKCGRVYFRDGWLDGWMLE